MRRRLHPDERRAEILAAATDAFAARPYDEVQLDDIARDARASRALINHYFDDKRGLFLAVARQLAERMPLTVRLDLDLDTEAMVTANTDAWLDMLEASRETSVLLLGAGPLGRDPELEAISDGVRDAVAERILVNHLGTTDIPPAARRAMRAATGMMELALRDWVTGRGGTREETRTLIVQSVLAIARDVVPAVVAADQAVSDRC